MQITISSTGTAGPPTAPAGTLEISLHSLQARLILTRSGSRAETPLPLGGADTWSPQTESVGHREPGCCRERQRCIALISAITQMIGFSNVNAAEIQINCSIANSLQRASSRLNSTTEAVHRLLKTSNRTPQVDTDREIDSSSPT